MRHTKLISAFLLLLVITFSLVALVNPKANVVSDGCMPFASNSLVQEIAYGNQNATYLNQTTRVQIYNFITSNPGTNFRGICNALTLPIGVVQYHLAVLNKGELISNRRDGRNKRYFVSRKFSSLETKIISVLRHETAQKILKILHDEGSASHGELARRLDISSQALTWQMKQLKEEGLVTGKVNGATVNYSLDVACSLAVSHCLTVVSV